MMAGFVFDTSALLTVLSREDGLNTILEKLENAERGQDEIFIPFMALMELEYLLLRKLSPEETMAILALVRAWPIQVAESGEAWRHQAALIKSRNTLSVADAWIAALAVLNQAELIHKDPEYDQVPDLPAVRLPYKV